MSTKTSPLSQRSPWFQAAAIVFAIVVLLACKIVEEVRIEQDGSGTYRVDLTLVGEEKEMLPAVKEEFAKKPELRIVDEGPRGDDYFVLVEMPFTSVAELSDDQSTYTWEVSEAGAFTRKARLEVANRGGEDAVSEHRLEVTMPGKVVDSNAGVISGKKIVWDRLAAGRRGELYVEAEYLELPAGYTTKIVAAGAILIVGLLLVVAMRLKRRRQSPA